MSYVLCIWEKPSNSPWPQTVEDASKLVDTLRDSPPRQNPKFIRLAEQLTGTYPCITSDAAEELPQDELAWSGGPLDGRTERGVYVIGLNWAMIEEVQPFVVNEARQLGLNVMDEQAGQVFLWNGNVLGVQSYFAPSPNIDPDDDVPRGKDLRRIVFERLLPVMKEHGFKPRKTDTTFRKAFPGGWHSVQLHTEDRWPMYSTFRITVVGRFNEISKIHDSITNRNVGICDEDFQKDDAYSTTVLRMDHWVLSSHENLRGGGASVKEYKIANFSQIESAIEHCVRNFEEHLLGFLKKYETITGFDEIMNTNPMEVSPFYIVTFGDLNIISAFLARNPNLDRICEWWHSKPLAPERHNSVIKCIEYVNRERGR